MTTPVPSQPVGRREQTKQANRQAILAAGRQIFAEMGFGAASVRDIVRRTDLAAGTFYNYFPDKESVFRALLEEITEEVSRRTHEARVRAATVDEFVETGFRAFFAFLASDPLTFELLRRNAGTVRSMFDDTAIWAGTDELVDDLRRGIAAGLIPDHDTDYMAAGMVGAAFDIGVRMAEHGGLEVDRATQFCTDLFLGGLERMRTHS